MHVQSGTRMFVEKNAVHILQHQIEALPVDVRLGLNKIPDMVYAPGLSSDIRNQLRPIATFVSNIQLSKDVIECLAVIPLLIADIEELLREYETLAIEYRNLKIEK